ncbi:hypothetical protein [Virgibacillus senegalensis]|uniref:hypothetical protein n=1 Tax=Virgibacillus senegalensis TaxID=1499679 RepID=UPI00069D6B4D|nr:hypothetical protein [Virgibacillus senegalensis]
MQKTYIGLAFLLLSAIIYGSTLIAASNYSYVLLENGWNGQIGIFGTALKEVGTIPIIIAILLGVIGVVLILKAYINKQ